MNLISVRNVLKERHTPNFTRMKFKELLAQEGGGGLLLNKTLSLNSFFAGMSFFIVAG